MVVVVVVVADAVKIDDNETEYLVRAVQDQCPSFLAGCQGQEFLTELVW